MAEMVEGGMEDVGRRSFCQGRMKKSAEEFYYRRMVPGDEIVKCLVLNELKLTAREAVGWEAVNGTVKSYNAAQQKRVPDFEKTMGILEEQSAVQKTARRKNQSLKR